MILKSFSRIAFLLLISQANFAVAQTAPQVTKLTDLAALGMQDKSIKKLKSLLHQYQGTSREPELLARLGDLYLERSGITFRVSEGTSIKNKSPLYLNSLKEASTILSELIRKYPYHALAPVSYFKRGKAYKELGQIQHAKEDFLCIQNHFTDFDYLDSVLIDLADFAQDANQHQEALGYLLQIEKMGKNSDYFPMALHKAAWSYFNLASYKSGMVYLEKEMNVYYEKLEQTKNKTETAENAFLESAFNDYALFYFEAINKKSDFANVDDAVKTFKRLDKNDRFFGQSILKFAKLLKAYTLIPELDRLRKKLVDDYKQLPETSEVALILFQFHYDRRDFNHLNSLISDLKTLRSDKNQTKIEQALSGALADLHKLVLKNKLATERGTLVRPLISLTESVNELLGGSNATALLANYALAETLFELKDFAQATGYYHGLLKPEYQPVLEGKKLAHSAIYLRLLSSRYQELKVKDLFPSKVKVKSLKSDVEPAAKEQIALMNEWVKWLDESATFAKTPEEKPSYDAFVLEANKLIYLYFDHEQAVTRLTTFGLTSPESEEGITSLTLVLDTLSESGEHARIYDLTGKISALKGVKNKEFVSKNEEMKANSHLKITLDSKDNVVTLQRSEECIKQFKDAKVLNECRSIHAKTAAALGQNEVADKEITELLAQKQDPTHVKSFLLLRADARNKMGHIPEAIQDLNQYQGLTHYEDAQITEQILEYSWFRNDEKSIEALLKNKEACSGKNKSHCDQYEVARLLDREEGKTNRSAYLSWFKNTTKAPKEVQSLWAMLALKNPKALPFQDRLILLQRLANAWDSLNPLLQIRLFPKMTAVVSEALESVRISAPGIAPLSSDASTIERRMRLMQDVDLTFSKVMKLNWLEIKQKGADELAVIYEQLVRDLKEIHTPEELLGPFVKKVAEIHTASDNLLEMAMEFKPVARDPASKSIPTADSLLLSDLVKQNVPSHLWGEWTKGVTEKRRDYLFHLVSLAEIGSDAMKIISPTLKGLILLLGGAPTEAYALIESAPSSPWKSDLLTQFERRKP